MSYYQTTIYCIQYCKYKYLSVCYLVYIIYSFNTTNNYKSVAFYCSGVFFICIYLIFLIRLGIHSLMKVLYLLCLSFLYLYIQWWPKLLEHLTDLKILTLLPPKYDLKHEVGCSEHNKYQIKWFILFFYSLLNLIFGMCISYLAQCQYISWELQNECYPMPSATTA